MNAEHIPFDFIKKADPKNLIIILKNEHPQTIACVLSYLEPKKAVVILRELPEEIQNEVTKRISCMDIVAPEILLEVERALEKKLFCLPPEYYVACGGPKLAKTLMRMLRKKGNSNNSHSIVI